LRLLTSFDSAILGGEVDQQVDVVVPAVELGQLGLEVGVHVPHDLFHAGQMGLGEHLIPQFRDENQMSVQGKTQCLPALMSLYSPIAQL
jgi:hypothetical protein